MVTVLPPSNYDDPSLLIRVNAGDLFFHASDLTAEGQAIADAVTAMDGVWNNLMVGWAGDTAQQAQDLFNRFTAVLEAMFGTDADPDSGAFAQLVMAVSMAAINYGEAEDSNQKMFQSLSAALNSKSSNPTPFTRSDTQGPITEYAPAPS